MMRKKNRLKIQPKEGSLSIYRHLKVMTKIQEDSSTIKTYLENTKLNNQEKKDVVHDCLGENHVYTPPTERDIAYVCIYQGKTCIYVLKNCQVKDTTKKLKITQRNQKIKTLLTPKRRFFP
jgi:hypothetical protein